MKLAQAVGGFWNEPRLGGDGGDVHLVDMPIVVLHFAQQRLCVQDADDVVGIATAERYARVRAVEDLAYDLARGQLGIDHVYIHAMGHDLADLHIVQVHDTAEHQPLMGCDDIGVGVQADRAAQLFLSRLVCGRSYLFAKQAQQHRDDDLDGLGQRGQQEDDQADDRADGQRHIVGMADGIGLGQHLGEDDYQHCHRDGGIGHPCIAEKLDHHAGRQCRG